jgi:hypothetical protein
VVHDVDDADHIEEAVGPGVLDAAVFEAEFAGVGGGDAHLLREADGGGGGVEADALGEAAGGGEQSEPEPAAAAHVEDAGIGGNEGDEGVEWADEGAVVLE